MNLLLTLLLAAGLGTSPVNSGPDVFSGQVPPGSTAASVHGSTGTHSSSGNPLTPVVTITALPWTRQVTCTGAITLTGSATNTPSAVSWTAQPDGATGSCTGTSSWSCSVSVSPNAAGEGVETVTITAASSNGNGTKAIDVGFYVTGAHSCFLAQNYDGAFNVGKTDATAVATWTNLGSSAKNLTQGTGTQQPLYKTPVKNTQPMVRFDGTNDNMTHATAADWLFLYDGTASTQEVVYATTDANPNTILPLVATTATLSSGASKGSSLFHDDRASATREDKIVYSVSNGAALNYALVSADDEAPAQTYNYVSAICSDDGGAGNDGFIFTNTNLSVQGTRANAYATTETTTLFIGTNGGLTQFLKADVWRILIYQSALTSTQRSINKAVDDWALGGSLPLAQTQGAAPTPDQNRWVFVGDSITAGALGVTKYSDKLAAYAPGKTFAVDATGGDKSFDALNSWRDVIVAGVPGKAFILIGVNNFRTDDSAANTYVFTSRIYREAASLGVQVVAMQPLPFKNDSAWNSTRQAQADAYRVLLASDTNISVLVDLYSLMGKAGDPEALATAFDGGDHLHPSEAGTQFMADTLKTALGL